MRRGNPGALDSHSVRRREMRARASDRCADRREHAALDNVEYAIEQSISRKNGIVGLFVHDIPDENGNTSTQGMVPYEAQAAEMLDAHYYDVHVWEHSKFEDWVEEAATEWKIYARPELLTKPGT